MVIALASFIVGAGLTGLLCCIHHRKATPKSVSLLHRDLLTFSSIQTKEREKMLRDHHPHMMSTVGGGRRVPKKQTKEREVA